MVVSVLIVFIMLFIYLKYPQVFNFKTNFVSGRYIRLEREAGNEPIGVANFIIYDIDGNLITPNALSVNPSAAAGNGRFPIAASTTDDIVLIATISGSNSMPYIEYDIGTARKISRVLIVNRKKSPQLMQKTVLRVLDEDRNQIFEKKISDLQDMYSINIS